MDERSHGHIEVIAGGMFSGKSEELVRRLKRAVLARQRVQVFQPTIDTRHSKERLVTRDGRQLRAESVDDSAQLRAKLQLGTQVVGIDEAQFFDDELPQVVVELANAGLRVIIAGLDMDFRGRPFGPMPQLMAVAEYVDKVHAICIRCGKPAGFSQRIAGGDDQVQVGDAESYEARCRRCYEPTAADETATSTDEAPVVIAGPRAI
ncbi:MAG: thymidine kinase [Acidobacteriota bacterium]